MSSSNFNRDRALFEVLKDCKTLPNFLDAVFGFLGRNEFATKNNKMDAIPNFAALIQPSLGPSKITSCKVRNLVPDGENYGSILRAVDLILDDKQPLYLVAKMCPTSEAMKQMFNVGVTFKKEVALYKSVVPALQAFQKRNNCIPLDSFAKCYGSRYSLDVNKTEVDDGCCFILENMKIKGYELGDRFTGFNLDCTRFIVQDLAKFHAIPVAFKLREPENFKKHVYDCTSIPNFTRESFPEETARVYGVELLERIDAGLEKYRQHRGKIEKLIEKSRQAMYDVHTFGVEPFASLVHMDLWTNNTMIKKDAAGKCVANCFVDFQCLAYSNPCADLMFFLYTSAELSVVKEHYQELIDLYFDTFIQVLREHGVQDLTAFTKELYLREIDSCMIKTEMYHCLFMLTPIFARKEKATEHSQLDMASINDRSKMDHEKYYARLEFVLDDFVRRGWLEL